MTASDLDPATPFPIGALSGFDIGPSNVDPIALHHRCGWVRPITWTTGFLAHIVMAALEHRTECPRLTEQATPAAPPEKLRPIVGLTRKCDDPTCSVCGDPDGPGAFACADR